MNTYSITPADPESADAQPLLQELSSVLAAITGASGTASFNVGDARLPRSLFVIARDERDTPLGCGALRPLSDEIAEVKRMYARPGTHRVGSAILAYLEEAARNLGYTTIWLETRRINERAVRFYLRRGYNVIANYGTYINRPEAICFGKDLGANRIE